MLPLLAQATAQLPDNYKGISVLVVGGVVTMALTGGVILAGFQRLRSALAAEMKREMEVTAKAMSVQVQSPLIIQAQRDFVTTAAHKESIDKIEAELKRHADRRAEIYDTQKEQGAAIAALVEKTDLMNATQIRQEGKIDLILQRLPRV